MMDFGSHGFSPFGLVTYKDTKTPSLFTHFSLYHQQNVKDSLSLILATYLSPAFGSLTKREIDILIFNVLEKIGYIEENPTLYSLVKKLRVTRSKARYLLYERELRRFGEKDLDQKVLEILKHPIIQKQAELFVLEIENPLVIDHLRSRVQSLGYASDGSFSPSLVKLSDMAIIALLDDMLDKKTKSVAREEFIKVGLPDKSFKGFLKDILKALGKKAADEAGSKVVENVLGPIIDGTVNGISKVITEYGINTIIQKERKDKSAG
jgi:hypothetical protein